MKTINGIMIAESVEKAVFYFFNKGHEVTDVIDLNMYDVVNICNGLGKNLVKANRDVRTWKKAAFAMSVATGVLMAINKELREEAKECKREVEDMKLDIRGYKAYEKWEDENPMDI